MTIKPNTISALFILGLNALGIHNIHDKFDLETWLVGFICMVGLPCIWFYKKRFASFFLVITLAMVFVTLLMPFLELKPNEVFFSGGSFGFIAGIIAAYFVYKPKSYEVGLSMARVDKYPSLIRYFEKKIESSK